MNPDSRRRGRPRGSSRYNASDTTVLNKIAELVTDAAPPVAPTVAMRKLGFHERSAHRRLQRKWKEQGPALVEAVRERRRGATARSASEQGGYGPPMRATDLLRLGFEQMQRLQDMADPPGLRGVREAVDRIQRYRDMIEPTGLRLYREAMEREQRWRNLVNPPGLRALREVMEQQTRFEEMVNPPGASALRPFSSL